MSKSKARNLTPDEYQAELMRVFHLDDQDLAANRQGIMGPRQVQRLVRSATISLVAAVVADAAILALILAVAARPFKPVQIILSALVLAALPAIGIVYYVKLRADTAGGQVDHYAGPIRKQLRGRAGWFLYVGDRDFRMPVQPNHIADMPHHVYATRKAKRIVAMEPDWG